MLPHPLTSPDLCSPARTQTLSGLQCLPSAEQLWREVRCPHQELPSMVLPVRDNQGTGFLGASNLSEGPWLLPGSSRNCP